MVFYGLVALVVLLLVLMLYSLQKFRGKLRREKAKSEKNKQIESVYISHITRMLRLPLNTIDKACDALQDTEKAPLSDEEREKLIKIIHMNSHEMFTYMDELLEITNFDGAVPAISTIEVNLIELVMSYRREIMHEAKSGVLVCVQTNMSPHCKATLNTTLFRQLVINLLRIAARRTIEGAITIRYDWEREGLHFWIEDTGKPIPDNVRETLFSDDVSEENIVKLENKSTFISLSVCKTIVKSMDGTIKATPPSEETGNRTVIEFWIPCYVRFD